MNYQSVLHCNDQCHVITPVPDNEATRFSTRSPENTGIDFIYNDIDKMKVWVRFKSVKAANHPPINNLLTNRARPVFVSTSALQNTTLDDVSIIPGCTTFSYKRSMFRVMNVSNEQLEARVLQSNNVDFTRNQIVQFHDINEVKQYILDSNTNY